MVMAGREILDRGYGKATQGRDHLVCSYDFSRLSDEQSYTTYELLKLAAPTSMGDTD
jgi:hypothetical protein